MNILITGATGFVGSWLTKRLLAEGLKVRILRRKSSDVSSLNGLDIDHFLGDITDLDSLLSATEGVDSVFHLAGLIGYTPAQRPAMELVNVQGTKNVIQACLVKKVNRLVYMSSVVAIGASFTKEVLNEDSDYNLARLNLGYFETKRKAEMEVVSAVKDHQLDAVILNPSTIYGPGDALKGSRKTQVKVARGKFPFYTSGGVSIANVKDVVEAVSKAWKIGKSGERFILGGENISIKHLFELIASANNVSPPKFFMPNTVLKGLGFAGDILARHNMKAPVSSENAWTAIMYHWFDSTKACKQLEYKMTPAAESIEQSVNWMRKNHLLD